MVYEAFNYETNVRAAVMLYEGAFDVAAFDLDSGLMVAFKSFAVKSRAIEYAAKFVADEIPAGTYAPL